MATDDAAGVVVVVVAVAVAVAVVVVGGGGGGGATLSFPSGIIFFRRITTCSLLAFFQMARESADGNDSRASPHRKNTIFPIRFFLFSPIAWRMLQTLNKNQQRQQEWEKHNETNSTGSHKSKRIL